MTTSNTSTKSPAPTKTNHKELLQRTVRFARNARSFVGKTPRTLASLGDCRQLIKCSGAIGSSYIEADQSPSRSIFLDNIQTCRRYARQSSHWLQLLNGNLDERSEKSRSVLEAEALELEKIFGAIVGKMINKAKAAAAQAAA